MSGVAAIYNRTGQPLDPLQMDRMLDAIAHRGPDARGAWSAGCVGLGHVLLAVTSDSVLQRQPLAAPDGAARITFDGRIDNRADIEAALERTGIRLHTSCDAELMLGAYLAWGDAFVEKVLGDFALIIWDARRRQLVCARDILGVKPVYYYADASTFICGSELQQIFAAGVARPAPNEGMIGEHLSDRVTNREETLYRHVFRLPAAHLLIVAADRLVKREYFRPDPSREVVYRSDGEYAEHYKSLLDEAVSCRVRSDRPVAAYLSGGLDSSAVVCVAEQLRRTRAIAPVSLETFSMTAPGMDGDESAYIHDMVRQWSLSSHELEIGAPARDTFVDQVRRYGDTPEWPNVLAAAPLARLASDMGCRAILTGMGGDDWLCAYATHHAELLARFRFREDLRHVRSDSCSVPGPVGAGIREAWSLLPGGLRSAVRRARGRSAVPPYITADFAERTSLADRLDDTPRDFPGTSRTRNEIYRWFFDGGLAYAHEVDDRHHAWFGLEARHPFHDRRIIEFTLAIPEEQRWRSAQTKFVLRNAMGELLPASVRLRLDKGGYSHTIVQALDACGGERCFDSLESAARGSIRQEVVTAMYETMRRDFARGDRRYATHGLRLWMIYGVELWLRYAFN